MYKYREIYTDMKRAILTNHYRAGSPLPTQEALTERYQVSRLTLKKALQLLIDDGLVYSKQGAGTFVRPRVAADSKELMPLDLPIGATDTHQDQPITSKTLYFNARLPEPTEQRHLQIDAAAPVYEFKRVRQINGKPYSFEHAVMPVAIAPLNEQILEGSVYEYLSQTAKLQLTDARRIVSATAADEETAAALAIEVGAPVFVIEQIAYDQQGAAFEYSISKFRGDHSRFSLDVHVKVMP